MTTQSRKNWDEDVFAFDDYHSDGGGAVSISDAVPGVPYLVTESVGQFNYTTGKKFDSYYRRSGNSEAQALQALRHAAAHNEAGRKPAVAGLVAWCAFEYSSLVNAYQAVKYPGIADVFRIPKLGAGFYLAQCDVRVRPVIEPNFYWDFGSQTPRGPGRNASFFSNCERLEIFVDDKLHATAHPDTANFPNLKSAPFFADLDMDGANHPQLRVDGYAGDRLVLSRSFSSDSSRDQLLLQADDEEIYSNGVDATRLVFRVADEFGAPRASGAGMVKFEMEGPGELVGDNPFDLTEAGGSGAVWIKTVRHVDGQIKIAATHSTLGTKTVMIRATGSAARSTILR
jgi:beta-galactosidase